MSDPHYGRVYWIALPIGAAVMTLGIVGLIANNGVAKGFGVAAWLAVADIAHDFIIAPLACLVGAVVARALPRWCRAPVQAALLTTGVILIVVYPALRGYGHDQVPDNPSVQPLDYTTATLTALAFVWGGAALWLILRRVTAGRRGARARAPASRM